MLRPTPPLRLVPIFEGDEPDDFQAPPGSPGGTPSQPYPFSPPERDPPK